MKRVIASIMIAVFVTVSFSGCKLRNSLTEYWDGMTKRETMEYVQDALQEKYSEEFKVKKLAYRSGSSWDTNPTLLAYCSPLSDENIVFQIEVDVFGEDEKRKRYMDDTYIQSIVGREMRIKAEQVLSQYVENFAVEIYVRGTSSTYDSKILSSNEATIENFTNALPEDNLSTIWFVFDINEFDSDYDRTAAYVEEIVDEYYLTNGCIICCFVSFDIVNECKEKIASNHIEYSYELLDDMQTTLSGRTPYFRYYFKGCDSHIDVSKFF